jgi:uncharacterized protein YggT (Ycf19 family)
MTEYPTVTETRHREVATERGAVPAGRGDRAAVTRTAAVTTRPGYSLIQLVWLIGGIVQAIIGLRVLFRALAANPQAAFVQFIDTISSPLVYPFRGIIDDRPVGSGMLDISALICMAVYLVATVATVQLIRILTAPPTTVVP